MQHQATYKSMKRIWSAWLTRGHSTHLLASDIEIQDVSSSNVRKSKNWVTENGSPINVAGQTELSLQIGKLLIKAVFKIARDLSQDIIIGVYILKPNGCILDFKTNELRIGNTCLKIQTIEPNIQVVALIISNQTHLIVLITLHLTIRKI